MLFEDLQSLYENFLQYKDQKEYRHKKATIQLESWAEDKAFTLENECMFKDFKDIKNELQGIEHPGFY